MQNCHKNYFPLNATTILLICLLENKGTRNWLLAAY